MTKLTKTQLSFLREHWQHRSWAHPSWVPDWVLWLEEMGLVILNCDGRVRANLTDAGRAALRGEYPC
jgi:hypothetical protein